MILAYFKKILIVITSILIIFWSCQPSKKEEKKPVKKVQPQVFVPAFNADSAYYYIQKQVEFGPRVPNTEPHKKCAGYLEKKLRNFGANVIVQKAIVKTYDGSNLNIKNIIGQFNLENKNRILLFAHWDSRPFADHSENPDLRDFPISGANDGASGVGVLLEIARNFNKNKPGIGVDIIFFDAEDYGSPDHKNLPYEQDSWCLGSQYWAKNMHVKNYYARYGILLDMVGAKDAIFTREGYSMLYASWLTDKVWGTGTKLGFSNYFDYTKTNPITDDHVYVNTLADIPSIDIIQYDPTTKTHFGSYWHTENDNMNIIDKSTLKAVGQTVMHVLYHEK